MSEELSEFGKGYAYCLGLFIAHQDRISFMEKNSQSIGYTWIGPNLWFNAASDHLFEIQIPDSLPKKKQEEIKNWVNKCLKNRVSIEENCTKQDCLDAINYAKNLLLEWDEFNGIPAQKAAFD